MDVTYSRISVKTPKFRRINELISSFLFMVFFAALLVCTYLFPWWGWVKYAAIALLILTFLSSLWSLFIEIPLFYKTFRYGITDDYLFIKKGVLTISEAVIPMAKIQSIELNQGILMRRFNLYSINITTMKDHHSIPYLDEAAAKQIRGELAKLARLKEYE